MHAIALNIHTVGCRTWHRHERPLTKVKRLRPLIKVKHTMTLVRELRHVGTTVREITSPADGVFPAKNKSKVMTHQVHLR